MPIGLYKAPSNEHVINVELVQEGSSSGKPAPPRTDDGSSDSPKPKVLKCPKGNPTRECQG